MSRITFTRTLSQRFEADSADLPSTVTTALAAGATLDTLPDQAVRDFVDFVTDPAWFEGDDATDITITDIAVIASATDLPMGGTWRLALD